MCAFGDLVLVGLVRSTLDVAGFMRGPIIRSQPLFRYQRVRESPLMTSLLVPSHQERAASWSAQPTTPAADSMDVVIARPATVPDPRSPRSEIERNGAGVVLLDAPVVASTTRTRCTLRGTARKSWRSLKAIHRVSGDHAGAPSPAPPRAAGSPVGCLAGRSTAEVHSPPRS